MVHLSVGMGANLGISCSRLQEKELTGEREATSNSPDHVRRIFAWLVFATSQPI